MQVSLETQWIPKDWAFPVDTGIDHVAPALVVAVADPNPTPTQNVVPWQESASIVMGDGCIDHSCPPSLVLAIIASLPPSGTPLAMQRVVVVHAIAMSVYEAPFG
jgi:hypothetical protein